MITKLLIVLIVSLSTFANASVAQAADVGQAVYDGTSQNIHVILSTDISAASTRKPVRALLYYEDSAGILVQVLCKAEVSPGALNEVVLSGFKDLRGAAVRLDAGVLSGKPRTYKIFLKDLQLIGEDKADDKEFSVRVPVNTDHFASLSVADIKDFPSLPYDRSTISLKLTGYDRQKLLGLLKERTIKVKYQFDKNGDFIPDIETTASVKESTDPNRPRIELEPARELLRRPAKFKVTVILPDDLDAAVAPCVPGAICYVAPPKDPSTSENAVSTVADLPASKLDRPTSEFYFENTFSSNVDAKARKRSNVGVFGLHFKPVIPIRSRGVSGEQGERPNWLALRPLFDADVDTQAVSKSKSPNRVTFGMDLEKGWDFQRTGEPKTPTLPQLVWLNGLRYDSDRDFKLQTLYWHTELAPAFRGFEQSREYRRSQYLAQVAKAKEAAASAGQKAIVPSRPAVSAYRFKPSFGYELGGTVRRDARALNAPTQTIARPFFALDSMLEINQVMTFSIVNTYYFLESANRRRSRDYLEARWELNTGFLFGRDLGGLQNGFVIKFQRGDQPPTFGPVNVFSLGYKIFR